MCKGQIVRVRRSKLRAYALVAGARARKKLLCEIAATRKSFLKGMNMLIAEYDYDTDITVQHYRSSHRSFQAGSGKFIINAIELPKRIGLHAGGVKVFACKVGVFKTDKRGHRRKVLRFFLERHRRRKA